MEGDIEALLCCRVWVAATGGDCAGQHRVLDHRKEPLKKPFRGELSRSVLSFPAQLQGEGTVVHESDDRSPQVSGAIRWYQEPRDVVGDVIRRRCVGDN